MRQGIARQHGRDLVTQHRHQGGDEADRAAHVFEADVAVGENAADTPGLEREDAVSEDLDRLENALGDQRFHHVQLELTGFGRQRHRQVVADDLEGDLVDDLRDHRINLARHDRRTRLHRRQLDFGEAGAGSGG